jgi:RNA polymerase sigma factor (TIGR02999 family)
MSYVTIPSLIASAEAGDSSASSELFSVLYNELRRLARREHVVRGGLATLGATTLLHEAYLQMSARAGTHFPDHARFMAYAARVMRGLIIDHVRRRRAVKRGGQFAITAMDTTLADPATDQHQLQRMSDALDDLAAVDAPTAEVVDLKFFCGFSFTDIAAMRGVSERTVQRHWEKARIYLHRALGDQASLA